MLSQAAVAASEPIYTQLLVSLAWYCFWVNSTLEYGPISVGVYLTLSFTVFCCCLASIQILDIDAQSLKSVFDRIKGAFGYESSPNPSPSEPITWLPEWAKSPAVQSVGTKVLLAIGMTKLFVPLKVGMTAAITPMVAKKLRAMGFNLGQKGGLREASRRVRNKHEP